MVQDLLTESVDKRFGNTLYLSHVVEWLTGNGSCYIADSTRAFAASLGLIVCTTPVRSPESNGMAESLVKTFRRDCVYINDLSDAVTVMGKLARWMEDYNDWHPHKGPENAVTERVGYKLTVSVLAGATPVLESWPISF